MCTLRHRYWVIGRSLICTFLADATKNAAICLVSEEQSLSGYILKYFGKIAKCYRFGRGVERDLKKAEYYEQEAEKAGNDDALWMRDQQYLLNILK